MVYNIKFSNGDRNSIIEYIKEKKKNGPFTVVDVGGTMGGWSTEYVDAIIDFNGNDSNTNIKFFKCDITNYDDWEPIKQYISLNGKFDFCICTHTLEDIMNPVFVSRQMELISKEGYIAFPSKYKEFVKFERGLAYRGYIHHRWIFDVDKKNTSNIIAYPKINYIENEQKFDVLAQKSIYSKDYDDLSFYWKDSNSIQYLNNNYLGPSVSAVIQYYDKLLD